MENTNPREERARKLLENPNTHKRNRAKMYVMLNTYQEVNVLIAGNRYR